MASPIFTTVLLWSFLVLNNCCALTLDNPPAGRVYELFPDPNLPVDASESHAAASPDIPLTYDIQSATNYPEEVLLTLASRDGSFMFVSWITPRNNYTSATKQPLYYGTSTTALTSVAVGFVKYSYPYGKRGSYLSGAIFRARIPVKPSTVYYFQIGGAQNKSSYYRFVSPPRPGETRVHTLVFLAGGGQSNDSKAVYASVAEAAANLTVFVGDLSFADKYQDPSCIPFHGIVDNGAKTCGIGGPRWDSWERLFSNYFAELPVVFAPGEHDLEVKYPFGVNQPLIAYRNRIPKIQDGAIYPYYSKTTKLPNGGYPADPPQYYSIDTGLVHLILFNQNAAFSKYTPQYLWLQDDLASVNRAKTPWVIFATHIPWYTSDAAHYREGEAARVTFEQLLFDSSVNFVISGHVSGYERTSNILKLRNDVCGPVHITVGSAGNVENATGPVFLEKPAYTVARSIALGYLKLLIKSASLTVVQWVAANGTVIDSAEITNTHTSCPPSPPPPPPRPPPPPLVPPPPPPCGIVPGWNYPDCTLCCDSPPMTLLCIDPFACNTYYVFNDVNCSWVDCDGEHAPGFVTIPVPCC